MTVGLGRFGNGVLRMVRPGVLLHWCDGCGCGHTLEIHALNHYGKVIGWDGDVEKPSIGEAVRHEEAGQVCEYVLRAGVLYYLSTCTHTLRGQAVSLRDYPMPGI
jgi:hypothetical protein